MGSAFLSPFTFMALLSDLFFFSFGEKIGNRVIQWELYRQLQTGAELSSEERIGPFPAFPEARQNQRMPVRGRLILIQNQQAHLIIRSGLKWNWHVRITHLPATRSAKWSPDLYAPSSSKTVVSNFVFSLQLHNSAFNGWQSLLLVIIYFFQLMVETERVEALGASIPRQILYNVV